MQTNTVPPKMKDRYTLRCIDAKAAPSKSSGIEQLTLTCEIVDPAIKSFDGEDYDLTSIEVRYYVPLEGERYGKTLAMCKKLGITAPTKDSPLTEQFVGMTFDAILDSAEKMLTKPDPDKKGAYVPITDAKGAPIKLGWEIKSQLEEVLYPSTVNS